MYHSWYISILKADGALNMLKACEEGKYPDFQDCLSILAKVFERLQHQPNVTRINTERSNKVYLCVREEESEEERAKARETDPGEREREREREKERKRKKDRKKDRDVKR